MNLTPQPSKELDEAMLETIEQYITLLYPDHELNSVALARQIFKEMERDVRSQAPHYVVRPLTRYSLTDEGLRALEEVQ